MLRIRPDQVAMLDVGFVADQLRRLELRNQCHAEAMDPFELSSDALQIGVAYEIQEDDDLERLSDLLVTLAGVKGDQHTMWLEATLKTLFDIARPAATRLDFIENHILPRLSRTADGQHAPKQE